MILCAGIWSKKADSIKPWDGPRRDNCETPRKGFLRDYRFWLDGVLSAKALLSENPQPTRDEIETAIEGNIYRCGGYVQTVRAIKAGALCNRN